jgi:hypothetical protein
MQFEANCQFSPEPGGVRPVAVGKRFKIQARDEIMT